MLYDEGMTLVWMVDCKICALRFAVLPREATHVHSLPTKAGASGAPKSTDALEHGQTIGRRECPHCHEFESYSTDDLIPGEGRIIESQRQE